jgi:hypothetical protein
MNVRPDVERCRHFAPQPQLHLAPVEPLRRSFKGCHEVRKDRIDDIRRLDPTSKEALYRRMAGERSSCIRLDRYSTAPWSFLYEIYSQHALL